MPKQKGRLQRRIDRLTSEKRELLSKIERLLRELRIVKQEHQRKGATNVQGLRPGKENCNDTLSYHTRTVV